MEIPLILQLCLPGGEAASLPEPLDAAALLRRAEPLGVFPAIFNHILALGRTAPLEGSRWPQLFRQNYARNLAIERRQSELLAALTAAGIPCRPIKGVRLIDLLYPDLSWRLVGDIDLLVPRDRVAAAYDQLKTLGLCNSGHPWTREGLERLIAEPPDSFAEVMLAGADGIPVELHWDWVGAGFPAGDPAGDGEAYLVYLCRHAGKHFWSSLQWVCDIELFVRKFRASLDWDRFWELARAEGAERSCAASFHLCAQVFARPLRAEEQRLAARAGRRLGREAAERLLGEAEPQWSNHPAWRLLKVDNWRQRIRRLTRWLAPPAWHWNHPEGDSPARWLRRYRRLFFRVGAHAAARSPLWSGRFEKAADFSLRDWLALGEGYLTLVIVQTALRVAAFPRVERWATAVRRVSRLAPDQSEALVARQAWLLDVAANHHLAPMRCLPRSLALARMLARRGIRTDIRMGVRREGDGRLAAHAWLEWCGRAINDPTRPAEEYAPIETAARR